jgi:hypothetical protein
LDDGGQTEGFSRDFLVSVLGPQAARSSVAKVVAQQRGSRSRTHQVAAVAVAVAGLRGTGAVAGAAANTARGPSAFELVIDGSHNPVAARSTFSLGDRREGSYAASAPFCPTGDFVDLEYGPLGNWITGLNRFTCGDGSGSVTARTWLVGADDELVSSVGAWQILAGTGEYEELRGMGMHASSQQSGAVEDDATPGYIEAWSGRVAFDAMAPTLTVSRASASQGARDDYLIRVELSTRDNLGGNPVSFMLTAWSRFLLAAKSGTTSTGRTSIAVRIRSDEAARRIRLKVEVWVRSGTRQPSSAR